MRIKDREYISFVPSFRRAKKCNYIVKGSKLLYYVYCIDYDTREKEDARIIIFMITISLNDKIA